MSNILFFKTTTITTNNLPKTEKRKIEQFVDAHETELYEVYHKVIEREIPRYNKTDWVSEI